MSLYDVFREAFLDAGLPFATDDKSIELYRGQYKIVFIFSQDYRSLLGVNMDFA